MEYHPLANLFPMMNDEEFNRLKSDIAHNGLREAIWTYQGRVIDGRNRYEACQELGIKPEFREWNGDGSLIQFVVSLNLSRRHLDSSQRAIVAVKVQALLEEEAKERQLATLKQNSYASVGQKIDQRANGNGNHGRTAYQAAILAGTNRQYVNDAKVLGREAPELLDLVSNGTIKIQTAKELSRVGSKEERDSILERIESGEAKTVKKAQRLIRQEEQSAIPDDMPNELLDRCQFFCGELEDVEHLLEDGSVDAILTFPPERTEVYYTLAVVASRVLKPGGSLLCTVDQSMLLSALTALDFHLDYRWTLALIPEHPRALIAPHKIESAWKPVLWLAKGVYQGPWVEDTVKSFSDLIKRFTKPGDTILDPFMRNGALVAIPTARMNRRVVGIGSLDALESTLRRLCEIQEHA